MDARTDEALLAAAAAGDDEAFALFYRRHLDTVLSWMRRRVRDPEVAFDLTAETFAAVVLGAGDYRGDAPAVAWLFGIARNKLLESLRRGRVEAAARQRLGFAAVALSEDDLRAVEERADAGALRLEEMLRALPEATRLAVLARVVEEREYAEIAAELRCSEQVVRQRVHRGLRGLRARLAPEEVP